MNPLPKFGPALRNIGPFYDVRGRVDDRAQLMVEISELARALKTVTLCDKLNIGMIGNIVPQLHVHIVARRIRDAAWPKPMWGVVAPRVYAASERVRLIASIKHEIGLA